MGGSWIPCPRVLFPLTASTPHLLFNNVYPTLPFMLLPDTLSRPSGPHIQNGNCKVTLMGFLCQAECLLCVLAPARCQANAPGKAQLSLFGCDVIGIVLCWSQVPVGVGDPVQTLVGTPRSHVFLLLTQTYTRRVEEGRTPGYLCIYTQKSL